MGKIVDFPQNKNMYGVVIELNAVHSSINNRLCKKQASEFAEKVMKLMEEYMDVPVSYNVNCFNLPEHSA